MKLNGYPLFFKAHVSFFLFNFIRTPEKLHTWIKAVVDAYHFSQEGSLIREARDLMNPKIIQKLEELKKLVENKFLWPITHTSWIVLVRMSKITGIHLQDCLFISAKLWKYKRTLAMTLRIFWSS